MPATGVGGGGGYNLNIYIKLYFNTNKNASEKHGRDVLYMDWPLFSAINKCKVFIHTGS